MTLRVLDALCLLHQPWLVLLGALWLAGHPARPNAPELPTVGLLSGVALGWLGWYLVERPGSALACMPARVVKAFQPGVRWRAPWGVSIGRWDGYVGLSARSSSPRFP